MFVPIDGNPAFVFGLPSPLRMKDGICEQELPFMNFRNFGVKFKDVGIFEESRHKKFRLHPKILINLN